MVAGMYWSQRMAEGMNRSARTVAVLSPAYVASEACAAEWQAAWPSDPVGAQRRLLPVRVAAFAPPAPFDGIVYTDLVGMAADVAAGRLTAAVDAVLTGGARPTVAPAFPGGSESPESSGSESPEGRRPRFPGVAPAVWSVDWPRNRLFTGREVELSLLRERLAGGGTAVAVASLALLAKRCGVAVAGAAEESARAVGLLAAGRRYRRWLLILDNAGEPDDLFGVLSAAVGCGACAGDVAGWPLVAVGGHGGRRRAAAGGRGPAAARACPGHHRHRRRWDMFLATLAEHLAARDVRGAPP